MVCAGLQLKTIPYQINERYTLTKRRDEVGTAKTAGLAWDGDVVVLLLVLLVGGHG